MIERTKKYINLIWYLLIKIISIVNYHMYSFLEAFIYKITIHLENHYSRVQHSQQYLSNVLKNQLFSLLVKSLFQYSYVCNKYGNFSRTFVLIFLYFFGTFFSFSNKYVFSLHFIESGAMIMDFKHFKDWD
jgi:hypothetical protein